MDYIEDPVYGSGDGLCSDNSCPCGVPGSKIPRGTGYLYISPDVVALRRKFPKKVDAVAEMDRRINKMHNNTNSLNVVIGGICAVLVCEQGARRRNLDLKVAALDAKHWWATGQVPLRPTPLTDGTVPSVNNSQLTGFEIIGTPTKQNKKQSFFSKLFGKNK